ncbi:MAG: HNH endonuclease [Actinomycetales bacterium]|uniref:HNH endonuclease n=1 Tax=Candidatus Phosphoribacter hodrii TaxID=2953743 RepID=A0A9D7TBP8_9MICO|nr:HNH endonuclease [Candidatus Phosphoribacter hodrii]
MPSDWPIWSTSQPQASGGVDTGLTLSAGQARRIACNAGLLPAVLGGPSLPLDLGRADRFFTEAQRVALATIYDECAADGCDRPYAWSELHHEDPWHAGGRTDLAKAVPLCAVGTIGASTTQPTGTA